MTQEKGEVLGVITDGGFKDVKSPEDNLVQIKEVESDWDKLDRAEVQKFIDKKIKPEELKIACYYEFKMAAKKGIQISDNWENYKYMEFIKISPYKQQVFFEGKKVMKLMSRAYMFKCPSCGAKKNIMFESE